MANTKRAQTNSTAGKYGEFSIKPVGSQFKVFKQGKYCCPFNSLADAEKYINEHRQPRRIVLTSAT